MVQLKIKSSVLMLVMFLYASLSCIPMAGAVSYSAKHVKKHPVAHVALKNKKKPVHKHLPVHAHQQLSLQKKNKTMVSAAALTHSDSVSTNHTSPGLMSSLGTRMVVFVRNTIATLRYTAYKLGGTHFDTSNGIYILDCSDYVDHLLEAANPAAYSSLVNSSGSDKPTSEHYYHFFTGLTYQKRHYWNKIDAVKELQPGDILVFRNQKNSRTGVLGHVMVVMKKPVRTEDSFIVRVTDAASVGHSQDTRLPHTSGIGIGTMQLKINPETGHPSAYAWKLGASWEKHVNFAMARPLGH